MHAQGKVFPIRRTVVSRKIMFNCFKNIIKRCLENKENAYSSKKNPRENLHCVTCYQYLAWKLLSDRNALEC